MCDFSNCYSTALRDILSDLVAPIYQGNKDRKEVQSTEEMLAKVEQANQYPRLKEVREGVLASMDVEALFPSINQKVSARMMAMELV